VGHVKELVGGILSVGHVKELVGGILSVGHVKELVVGCGQLLCARVHSTLHNTHCTLHHYTLQHRTSLATLQHCNTALASLADAEVAWQHHTVDVHESFWRQQRGQHHTKCSMQKTTAIE
jgi:hypothetical protein